MRREKPIGTCSKCGGPIPWGRNNHQGFCSKKCQAEVEGYTAAYERRLEMLRAKVEGTTAWAPTDLDKVEHVLSPKPVVVLSDMHMPMHSWLWLLQALACAELWGAEYCVLNGDTGDFNEISRHMGHYYRRRKNMNDDLDAMEAVFKLISERFRRFYWLSGNHCIERLIRQFNGELSARRLSKLIGDFPNLVVTSRSYLDVNSTVRLCHPRQYSRIRGALAQRLAQRWQKSIATGHQHHAAMTFSPCGKFQAVDIPAMVDVDKQDYIRNELNEFPEPMQGFGAVFGEYIQVFTEHTPWEQFGLPNLLEKKK